MTRHSARSPQSAQPGSYIESTASAGTAATAMPSAQDIFLAPRVVDQGAFEEFAGKLRLLVDRVAVEAGEVTTAIESARTTTTALRETEARQREQFDLAARVLKALSTRTDEVRALLDRAADTADLEQRLNDHAQRVIDQRVQEVAQRLTESSERAAAEVEARLLERRTVWAAEIDRMDRAVRQACEQAMTHLKSASDKVGDLCARAERLSGEGNPGAPGAPGSVSLADLVRRAESSSGGIDSMMQRLSALRSEAEASLAGLSRSASAARELLTAITTRHESLSVETRRTSEACDGLTARLAQTQRDARMLTETISMGRERANVAIDQLKGLVQAAEAVGASATAAELRTMLRYTDAAIKKLEPWRSLIETAGRDGQLPEPIARLVGSIREEICADLSEMARALSMVSQRAERVALREASDASSVDGRGAQGAAGAD